MTTPTPEQLIKTALMGFDNGSSSQTQHTAYIEGASQDAYNFGYTAGQKAREDFAAAAKVKYGQKEEKV